MPSTPLLLFLLITTTTAATTTATATNSTDLIRMRCSVTLHPSLCFHSLSHFSSLSTTNSSTITTPVRLAQVAANLTLVRLRSLSSLLHTSYTPTPALNDCRDCLSDAITLVAQSIDEIGRIEHAEGPQFGWRVSNVLTWMSAALTNEDTCADGLNQARKGNGPCRAVKRPHRDPCWRIHRAMDFTSNALALVNSLVAG